jgi:two-component system, NarL family, nitrate/nitrite response regulator NarL
MSMFDPGASELTVLLADDDVPTRTGVRLALESANLRVVAEVATAQAAVTEALSLQPDVCLMAIHLPGGGIEATKRIRDALPKIKIVMLTVSERDEDLFGSLRAGADGYLMASTSVDRLPHAIRGVVSGGGVGLRPPPPLPRQMTARLIREYRDRGRRPVPRLVVMGRTIELTVREFEVLERLRKHERTGEIAGQLGISDITVRRHVSAALRKLGVSSRREAVDLLEQAEQSERGAGAPLAA